MCASPPLDSLLAHVTRLDASDNALGLLLHLTLRSTPSPAPGWGDSAGVFPQDRGPQLCRRWTLQGTWLGSSGWERILEAVVGCL